MPENPTYAIFLKSWWLTHSKYDDRYLTLAIVFKPVTRVTLFRSYDQFYRAECITVSGFLTLFQKLWPPLPPLCFEHLVAFFWQTLSISCQCLLQRKVEKMRSSVETITANSIVATLLILSQLYVIFMPKGHNKFAFLECVWPPPLLNKFQKKMQKW